MNKARARQKEDTSKEIILEKFQTWVKRQVPWSPAVSRVTNIKKKKKIARNARPRDVSLDVLRPSGRG